MIHLQLHFPAHQAIMRKAQAILAFAFLLALILNLSDSFAAQFESFIDPIVVMVTVSCWR
jgi:multidrug efflux pump subunit AcrB